MGIDRVNTHVWVTFDTYVVHFQHICRSLLKNMEVNFDMSIICAACYRHIKSDLHMCQNWPSYVSKKTQIRVGRVNTMNLGGVAWKVCAAWYQHVKRDIHMCQKRPTCSSDEHTHITWVLQTQFALRDMNTSKETYMCQKRRIYMSKETHIFDETVHTNHWGVAHAVCASQELQHVAIYTVCCSVCCSLLQCVAVCCTARFAAHALHRWCSVISTLQ